MKTPTPPIPPTPMDMGRSLKTTLRKITYLLFSFKGRINRKKYFLGKFLLVIFELFVLYYIEPLFLSIFHPSNFLYFYLFSVLLLVFSSIAIEVKRLHDFNYSGFWIFTAFIPVFNLYIILRILFGRGTKGGNKYGENPLLAYAEQGIPTE